MPEEISLRQHILSQVRFRNVPGEGVQPLVFHRSEGGGEGRIPLRHGAHTAVYGLAQSIKLGLIVRHDPHGAVLMEVPGDLRQSKAELGKLLHGELEEGLVVRFEMNLPAHFQHLAVELQKVPVGQPPLGVAAAGPGVAEIDVDAVHLAGGEEIGELVRVGADKPDVGKARADAALHGHHHGVGHHIHRQEQHVRLGGGGVGGEAALAAAQLQVDLPGLGHQIPPMAGAVVGVPDEPVRAALHPGNQVFLFPHSHRAASS